MTGQMNLFEMINEARRNEAVPKFKNGQPIFVVSLDVVLEGIVSNSWVCGGESDEPYFGYSVDYDDGRHTVVWDYNIGLTVFNNKENAVVAAAEITPKVSKITPSEIIAHEIRCFGYLRNDDNYELTAIVAKVGEMQLYEKGFMCYHFLKAYKSKAERDKEYKIALNKALAEAKSNYADELEDPPYIDLYRVTKDLYASREYALRHGSEYAALMKSNSEQDVAV